MARACAVCGRAIPIETERWVDGECWCEGCREYVPTRLFADPPKPKRPPPSTWSTTLAKYVLGGLAAVFVPLVVIGAVSRLWQAERHDDFKQELQAIGDRARERRRQAEKDFLHDTTLRRIEQAQSTSELNEVLRLDEEERRRLEDRYWQEDLLRAVEREGE
jgi:hypothetical protein